MTWWHGALYLLLATEDATAYLITESGHLLELQEAAPLDAEPRSWLVDQTVHKDGTLFLATRVDPLFFLLPLLQNNGTRYSPFGQICSPEIHRVCPEARASQIADVNDKLGPDMVLYRFNEEKVLGWLHRKVVRLQVSPGGCGSWSTL